MRSVESKKRGGFQPEIVWRRKSDQRELWDEMLASAADVIYVVDLETRRVEYMNRSLHVDLGYSAQEVERPDAVIPQQFLHPGDVVDVSNLLDSLRQAKAFRKTIRLRLKTGGWRHFNLSFRTYRSSSGWRAVGTLTDVSRLKESQILCMRKKDEAERLACQKSEFLARMSHEIRTPLTAILATAEMLQQQELLRSAAVDGGSLMSALLDAASHLHHIVDEVLDLSRLEAGRFESRGEPCDPRALFESIRGLHLTQAARSGNQLCLAIDAGVPSVILADAVALRQMTSNLVGNAIRHTQSGSVKISVSLAQADAPSEEGERHGRLIVEVEDTGCGIPGEQLSQVFDCYRQVSPNGAGTGLGLAISRKIAESMSGSLTLRSVEGVGTTAVIDVPIRLDQAGAGAPAAESGRQRREGEESVAPAPLAGPGRGGRTPRILIVDDQPLIRNVMRRLCEQHGFSMDVASGARQVTPQAAAAFDIILLDYRMPEVSGPELAADLRRAGTEIPILCLTADRRSDVERECLAAGIDAVLWKPMRGADLLQSLEKHLQGRSQALRPAGELASVRP